MIPTNSKIWRMFYTPREKVEDRLNELTYEADYTILDIIYAGQDTFGILCVDTDALVRVKASKEAGMSDMEYAQGNPPKDLLKV